MSDIERPTVPAEIPGHLRTTAGSLWARFFSSKLLMAALVLVAVGTALWIRDGLAADPAPLPAPNAAASPAAGLATSPPSATDLSATDSPISGAPLTFRLGAGFLVGYFVGWLFRLFLRTLLLATGGLLLLIGVLKGLGWIDLSSLGLDWASVERHVHDGIEQATTRATAWKDSLLALVPGGATSFVGLFVGARRAR